MQSSNAGNTMSSTVEENVIQRERPRTKGFQLMCVKMRYTFLFIGIIICIFGFSLRLTFITDSESNSFDDKLWQSMRTTGNLLLAVGTATIILAIVLLWFSRRQFDNQSPDLEQPSDPVRSTGRLEPDNTPTAGDSRQSAPLFRRVIERIRKNWSKQAEWMYIQPRQTHRCANGQSCSVEYTDSPPTYGDILASSSSISLGSPPPYEVVI